MNLSTIDVIATSKRRRRAAGQGAFVSIVFAATLAVSGNSFAASTDTWTGATSTSFSTSTNWSGPDTPPATGDSLAFTGTSTAGTTLTDNLFTPGSYTIAGITFNSGALAYIINPATSGTNGFTLSGAITNNSTSLETINDIITLGASENINAASGAITLGGTITGGSYGLTVLGTNTVTLSGANTLSGLTLGTSVTANSNQNVALTGEYGTTVDLNNTQNIGAITLGSGLNVINVGAGDAITSTTMTQAGTNDRFDALNINLGTGASMTTTATNDGGGVLAPNAQFNVVTLNGTDFASNNSGSIGAATYTTLGATSTSTQNSNVTGNVTLTGSQTMNSLRFGATTGYTVTTASGSTLSLNGSSNGTGTILMGANDGAVTNTVTGGTLQGSSNRGYSFLNYDTTSGANLVIDSNINNYPGSGSASASTADVMVAGGGLVTLGGTNFINGEILIDASTLSVANDSNLGAVNSTVSVTSATNGSTSVTLAAASNTTGLAVGDVFLGQIVSNVSGTTVTLASAYTGTTITSATNVGFVGGGSVNLNGGTLMATTGFTLGETTSTGGTTSTRNRNVGLGVQGGTFDVASGQTLIVPGVISGTGALTKTDSGTLTLSGVNTYTGNTTVSGGTLLVNGAGQLNSGSYAGNILDNATLQYASSANQTLSGVISGSGALIQSGTGTLTLGSTNSYGSTTIDSGTIAQSASNALGSGTVTLGDGSSSNSATLLNGSGASLTDANAITFASGGTGTYTIENTNAVSGDLTLTGNVALNNAATYKATGGGAIFENGTITGSSLITIDGGGTGSKFVSLGANDSSSFTGNILVQNKGDLKFGNGASNALGTQTTVTLDSTSTMDTGLLSQTVGGLNDVVTGAGGSSVINGGSSILTLGGTGAYSFSGVISGTGSLVKSGTGTQTLAGASLYGGGTTISGGTLNVANTGSTTSATGTGGVSLGAATLSGTGYVTGLVTATGASGSSVIAPATATTIGTLTLNGGINAALGLTLNLAIDGTGATNSTLALGSGNLNVSGGALTFNLYDLGTDTLQANTPYTIMTGSGTSSISSITANLIGSTYTLNTSYGTDGILFSGDTATFEVQSVPEPSTWALLFFGLGAGGFAYLRRRMGFSFPALI